MSLLLLIGTILLNLCCLLSSPMSKKLLFIVNSSDFFISHRLQIALAAQIKGYQVLVASGDNASANQFSDLGIEHRLLPLSRSGRNPFKEIKLIDTPSMGVPFLPEHEGWRVVWGGFLVHLVLGTVSDCSLSE